MHLLKLAIRPWRSSPFLQFFSASAAGLSLFSAGLAGWCAFSLEPLVSRLSSEQVITAYLDPDLSKDEEAKVVDSVRDTIVSSLGAQAASDLKLVRAVEFIAQVREQYPDLAEQLDGLGSAELEAVVPRYVSASGKFQPQTIEAIRGVRGIGSVETSAHKTASLVGSLAAVRWIASVVAVALFAVAFALTAHVGRFNSQQYGEAVAFLRLMGGGAIRSRLPGLMAGLLFGTMTAAIATSSWRLGAERLLARLRVLSPVLTDLPSVPQGGAIWLAAAALATGLFVGLWFGGVDRDHAGAGGRSWL